MKTTFARVAPLVVLTLSLSMGCGKLFRLRSLLKGWGFSAFIKGSALEPLGSTPGSKDRFGLRTVVSESGVIAVGAPSLSNGGAVYTYERDSHKNWQARPKIPVPTTPGDSTPGDDLFGAEVAIVDHVIAVGTPNVNSGPTLHVGTVYAWAWDASTSSYLKVGFENETSPGAFSDRAIQKSPQASDFFGATLAMNQKYLAISRVRKGNATATISYGEVIIYRRDSTPSATYPGGLFRYAHTIQNPDIAATPQSDDFGGALSFAGPENPTLFIGASRNASACSGWTPSAFPTFGNCQQDHSIPNSGAVYIYSIDDLTSTPLGMLKTSSPQVGDQLSVYDTSSWGSNAIAVDQDILVVGSTKSDCIVNGVTHSKAGAAFVFSRLETSWDNNIVQLAQLCASNGLQGDDFGYSVAVDTARAAVVVGAPKDSGDPNDPSDPYYLAGSVSAFILSEDSKWKELNFVSPLYVANDKFGSSIAIHHDEKSKGDIIIGSPYNDSIVSGIFQYTAGAEHPAAVYDVLDPTNDSGAIHVLSAEFLTVDDLE